MNKVVQIYDEKVEIEYHGGLSRVDPLMRHAFLVAIHIII
jgi:hypothetical protein